MMAQTASHNGVTGKPRILVIDDNADFAENIAELIGDMGLTSEVALTGRDAVERFVRRPFEIAIVDLQLPDLPGTRVIARLKEVAPDCICIVFTGNATLGNAIEALNRGAFAYLVKGGEVAEFRAVLGKAVDLHRTEAELEKARGISRALLENFPGRMVILDAEGKVLGQNHYPLPWDDGSPGAGSRGARRIEDIFLRGQAWSQVVLDHFEEHRDAVAPTVLRRFKAPGADGEPRIINIHFVPLLQSSARWLVFVDDITQVARMEAEIERSARMAALGELSAMIAHEVRNPLSGISGAVQILRAKFPSGNQEREICDQIIAHVDRLDKTIEDILVLARPMSPKFIETSLGDLIDSTVDFLSEDAGFKDITFRWVAPPEEPRCRFDPFLLRQALLNVLINAAQAMDRKGTVTVSVSREAGKTHLKVQDEGPGFKQDAATLFEPFFTTKAAGTGLGLPITARILEVHGGTVTLRNHERGGAEVTFTIPGQVKIS
jgi:signal transduction histidine kinase